MLDLMTINKELFVTKKAKSGNNVVVFARMTWPKLFTASVNKADRDKPNAVKKFYLNLLLPPQTDLGFLKEECAKCAVTRWGADKLKEMRVKSPFLKAEDYKYEGHLPGWTFLRLSAISKPQVVELMNGVVTRITEDDLERVYGGRWAQVTLNPFAYPKAGAPSLGNTGISLGLNNVMLLNHDEALGGRMKAEDEFEAPEGDFGAPATGTATIDNLF